jgi:hypothetical protein
MGRRPRTSNSTARRRCGRTGVLHLPRWAVPIERAPSNSFCRGAKYCCHHGRSCEGADPRGGGGPRRGGSFPLVSTCGRPDHSRPEDDGEVAQRTGADDPDAVRGGPAVVVGGHATFLPSCGRQRTSDGGGRARRLHG